MMRDYWPDIRAGYVDATRTDTGPRCTLRAGWRAGWHDYRLGFLAGAIVRRLS